MIQQDCADAVKNKMELMEANTDIIGTLYQSKIEQTHMEPRAQEKTYDFTDLYSVIERKEMLKNKLNLS